MTRAKPVIPIQLDDLEATVTQFGVRLDQATLLGSLGWIWQNTPELCDLIPAIRVVTGRIPSTEEYTMPYVAILEGSAGGGGRTDKSHYHHVPITFHIWTNDGEVAEGERIENTLAGVYCDQEWRYAFGRVIDVLDEGPGIKIQADRTEFRVWETIKVLTLCLEHPRRKLCIPPPWHTSPGSAGSSHSASGSSASGSSAGGSSANSGSASGTSQSGSKSGSATLFIKPKRKSI